MALFMGLVASPQSPSFFSKLSLALMRPMTLE